MCDRYIYFKEILSLLLIGKFGSWIHESHIAWTTSIGEGRWRKLAKCYSATPLEVETDSYS